MPARQKPNLIEILVMVAILGILAAIVLPGLEQAKRRAQTSRRGTAPGAHTVQEPSASDGQLNTIEVSEFSQNTEQPRPEQYVGVFVGLVPIVISVLVVWFILTRLREQMSRRA